MKTINNNTKKKNVATATAFSSHIYTFKHASTLAHCLYREQLNETFCAINYSNNCESNIIIINRSNRERQKSQNETVDIVRVCVIE